MKLKTHFFIFLFFMLSCMPYVSAKNEYHIIPAPLSLKAQSGEFTFDEQTRIVMEDGLRINAEDVFFILSGKLNAAAGINLQKSGDPKLSNNVIVCKLDNSLPKDEAYQLKVEKNKIIIRAKKTVGFFYAAQTIRQLLPPQVEAKTKQSGVRWTVPCCEISDSPYYSYRGMHLDVCRHFSTVNEVKEYIDQLSLLKLNTFHWHLTDDQGWRIEIKKYPKLTEVGGFRNRTLIGHYNDEPRKWDYTRVGGFYTQEEIKDVVAYAQKRFISILPEIELPGHAVAALTAYPEFSCSGGPFEVEGLWGIFNDVYCSREETFEFLEDVLSEVAELFPNKYIHIGGDECPKLRWTRCHACQTRMKQEGLKNEHELQSYFIKRIGIFLKEKGKKFVGWDEILEGGLAPDATVMSWRGEDGGIDAARQGHDVIMTPSSHLYLDYYQSQLPSEPLAIGGYVPLEKVYGYNPTPAALTKEEAAHILGVQANLWTEYLPNQERREYMIFPRIAALSEIAWLPAEKKNYRNFQLRLPDLLQRYENMGVNYSKAFYSINGIEHVDKGGLWLELSSVLPGIAVHYTTDGSPVTVNSPVYKQPVALGKKVTVNAIPVENGNILTKPYSQTFIDNKAAGQKVILSAQPSSKYKGQEGLTLVDCVEGRYPILGSQWLGYEGGDVDITIEFNQPVTAGKLAVGSTQQPGQWIYAPGSVEFYVSENGVDFRKTGEMSHADILKNKSKAFASFPEITIKKAMVKVKNYGVIPAGEQGGGHRSWLFLDEVVVE